MIPLAKNKRYLNEEGYEYDPEELKKIADNLEEYTTMFQRFVLKEDLAYDEYKKAIKTVKKYIKYLRKGKAEKVFDDERVQEYLLTHDSLST